MNFRFDIKKTGICLLLLCSLFACRKKYAYNYQDGFPGDGEPVPNITVDTNVKNIDASKYAQARTFPGLVCSSEPRLNNLTLAMNLNYNLVKEELRISVPPEAQFSTGLYAAPGELVIIDVPTGNYSISAQVGAWTDNLSSIQNAPRDAVIYSRTQLAAGRNYIRNLYGGHIYIYSGTPIATPVNLVFSNVCKSPDFILGKTTDAEWKTLIQNSCVPWLELRSENLIFTVPRDYCITRSNITPTALMNEWNDAINLDFYQWEGLSSNPADPVDKAPLLPWRVVQDIKPSVGYGHSGFPVVTFNDLGWFDEFTDISQVRGGGCWGTFHEIGHNNQQGRYWSWSTLGETSNNLFVFKAAHRQEAIYPAAWPAKHPALGTRIPSALAFALDVSATKTFDGTDARIDDPFSRLTPFLQMFDKIPANWGYPGQPDGWTFMGELYKKARRATRISLSDIDKHDFVYEAICDFTRQDWQIFFQKWGILISNVSVAKMSAKYPLMLQEIWKYNPLNRTGGTTTFDPYSRTLWTVTATSTATQEGSLAGLTDGNPTTYWHTVYNQAPAHRITVNMNNNANLPIKGFTFTQRQGGGRNIKNLVVEISNDGTTWTPVSGSPFLLQRIDAAQNFLLPANIVTKWFRVSVLTAADTYNTGTAPDINNTALAEINVIKP
ncbi:MAG: M60 family metallopeptidase [Bacteroidota bacterium]